MLHCEKGLSVRRELSFVLYYFTMYCMYAIVCMPGNTSIEDDKRVFYLIFLKILNFWGRGQILMLCDGFVFVVSKVYTNINFLSSISRWNLYCVFDVISLITYDKCDMINILTIKLFSPAPPITPIQVWYHH